MTAEQKLDAIFDKVNSMEVKLEVAIAYQKVHDEKIDNHDKKIEVLEASRNIAIGKKTVFTLLAGSIGGIITFLIDHLAKQ